MIQAFYIRRHRHCRLAEIQAYPNSLCQGPTPTRLGIPVILINLELCALTNWGDNSPLLISESSRSAIWLHSNLIFISRLKPFRFLHSSIECAKDTATIPDKLLFLSSLFHIRPIKFRQTQDIKVSTQPLTQVCDCQGRPNTSIP